MNNSGHLACIMKVLFSFTTTRAHIDYVVMHFHPFKCNGKGNIMKTGNTWVLSKRC